MRRTGNVQEEAMKLIWSGGTWMLLLLYLLTCFHV